MTTRFEQAADSAVREIASPRVLREPTESFLGSTRSYLERMGWARSVAGDADFEAACLAWGRCVFGGLGLFVHGKYGCGKTSLMRLFHPLVKPAHFVPLGDPECARCLTDGEWIADALGCNVFLDDLGAESAVTDYGVKREAAAEFIVRFHARSVKERDGGGRPRRLFVTTNLAGEEVAQRYTLRVTSRIKELCLPLHLAGGDKRKWGAKAPVERRFAAVEGCAVASLPVEGEESSTPNSQPSTLNPQPSTRALREGGAE